MLPGLVGTPPLLPGRAGVARAGAGGWPGRPASGLACGLACDLVLAAAAQALPVCVQMPGPAHVLLHVMLVSPTMESDQLLPLTNARCLT